MAQDDLEGHSLPELIDKLGKATKELLELMNKPGADGIIIRDKRREVQTIQEAIEEKKSSKNSR